MDSQRFSVKTLQSLQTADITAYCNSKRVKVDDLKKTDYAKVSFKKTKEYISNNCFIMYDGTYRVWSGEHYDYYESKSFGNSYGNYFHPYVKDWFFKVHPDRFKEVTEVNRPRKYDDKLNLFPGFKHEYKDRSSDSDAIKEKADIFLEYMLEVLCSGKRNHYDFLCKWIGAMVKGEKNDACLYLRGIQGIGKSVLSNFLRKHVIGEPISITSNSDPLRSPFNRILCGKTLVIFEELPTFSDSEWTGISSKLKEAVTGATMIYSDKNVKSYEAKNINNYILNSNNNAIKDDEGRRYFILDLSTKRKGDTKYWSKVHSTFDDDVGAHLFSFFYECHSDGWTAQANMPMTQSKLDSIADRLPIAYKFIKEAFLEEKADLNIGLKPLYESYIEFCGLHNAKALQKTKFNTQLSEVGIECKKSHGQMKYNISLKDLKKIADKYHWVHALEDDSSEHGHDGGQSDSGGDDFDYKAGYFELLKQVEELKRKCEEKENVIVEPEGDKGTAEESGGGIKKVVFPAKTKRDKAVKSKRGNLSLNIGMF